MRAASRPVVALQLGKLRLVDQTEADDAQAVDLDRLVAVGEGVLALVLGVEAFQAGVEILLQRRRDGNGQRAPLTDVAHVHQPPQLHAVARDPLDRQPLPRLVFQLGELGFQRGAAGAVGAVVR